LLASPIAEAAESAASLRGGRLSVDLSSWMAIGGDFRARLERLRPDVVFGNEQEWEALGEGLAPPVRVVKRGARGFSVGGEEVAPAAGEVVDSTGAGDALAAGFLVGGPELAREAAARCVARLGAMP
jgi:sugar/nucleoside kinase (ribokinase family)